LYVKENPQAPAEAPAYFRVGTDVAIETGRKYRKWEVDIQLVWRFCCGPEKWTTRAVIRLILSKTSSAMRRPSEGNGSFQWKSGLHLLQRIGNSLFARRKIAQQIAAVNSHCFDNCFCNII
jgi:hypothetical protein